MSTIVLENLKVSELPEQWTKGLKVGPNQRVTVRIEVETSEKTTDVEVTGTYKTSDPAFGIWRDRDDVADVDSYVRKLRAPRYSRS